VSEPQKRVSQIAPLIFVILSTAVTLIISVRIGALTLAAGLALLAALAHLTRATRSPWRSQAADVGTLAALALGMAILAVALP